MKKTSAPKKPRARRDSETEEYRFDYRKAKPNRFAKMMPQSTVAVVLEPDVAAVFKTSDAVNGFLRSVISAMPGSRRRKTR